MNLALFSRGQAADGISTLPFVRQELRAFYPAGADVLITTAASGDSERAVEVAGALIADAGHQPVFLHEQPKPLSAIRAASAFFVSGGNVFRLAETMHRCGWLDAIRDKVTSGTPYAGISAGAVIAGPSIATTNSMPIVLPPSLDALALTDVHVNVHYPTSAEYGVGETREDRILEVVRQRNVDVLALRDGSGLRVNGEADWIIGTVEARFFPSSGREPYDLPPGSAAGPRR